MTQTECMDCTWSENCEWDLIVQNMVPMSPICVAKQWHDKSLKTFKEQSEAVQNKILGGKSWDVANGGWYQDWVKEHGKDVVHARVVTVGEFCKNSEPWPKDYQGA